MATNKSKRPPVSLPTRADPSEYASLLRELLAPPELEEIEITIRGRVVPFSYRPLTWDEKQRILGESTRYVPSKDDQGELGDGMELRFRHDVYNRECLLQMVVDPPFPWTARVIRALPDSVGEQFSAIIPNPFGAVEILDSAKKGPAGSSEEAPSPERTR